MGVGEHGVAELRRDKYTRGAGTRRDPRVPTARAAAGPHPGRSSTTHCGPRWRRNAGRHWRRPVRSCAHGRRRVRAGSTFRTRRSCPAWGATAATARRVAVRVPAARTTPCASTTTASSTTCPVNGSSRVPPSTTSGAGTGGRPLRSGTPAVAPGPAWAADAAATPAAETPASTAAPARALRRVIAGGATAETS